MSQLSLRKLACHVLHMLVLVLLAGVLINAGAKIRGAGKYCGVVIFDRWDTCYLLDGWDIANVSQSVKEKLRPYRGIAVQVDASKVYQPMNPGQAMIQKYEIIGLAPRTELSPVLDHLELRAESDFGPHGKPSFWISIRNIGSSSEEIFPTDIGPTLFGLSHEFLLSASDGPSEAVISSGTIEFPSSQSYTVDNVTYSASYSIAPKFRSSESIQLEPGQAKKIRVTFKLSPDQYQFMVGYGGGNSEGKSIASNAISFDVSKKGVATLAK